jgi:hypothetical protein
MPVTSQLAKQVVNIYSSRMQIEEGYRDMKSKLYGLGFNESESYKIRRIEILMLVAELAAMLLILIGAAASRRATPVTFRLIPLKSAELFRFSIWDSG